MLYFWNNVIGIVRVFCTYKCKNWFMFLFWQFMSIFGACSGPPSMLAYLKKMPQKLNKNQKNKFLALLYHIINNRVNKKRFYYKRIFSLPVLSVHDFYCRTREYQNFQTDRQMVVKKLRVTRRSRSFLLLSQSNFRIFIAPVIRERGLCILFEWRRAIHALKKFRDLFRFLLQRKCNKVLIQC